MRFNRWEGSSRACPCRCRSDHALNSCLDRDGRRLFEGQHHKIKPNRLRRMPGRRRCSFKPTVETRTHHLDLKREGFACQPDPTLQSNNAMSPHQIRQKALSCARSMDPASSRHRRSQHGCGRDGCGCDRDPRGRDARHHERGRHPVDRSSPDEREATAFLRAPATRARSARSPCLPVTRSARLMSTRSAASS